MNQQFKERMTAVREHSGHFSFWRFALLLRRLIFIDKGASPHQAGEAQRGSLGGRLPPAERHPPSVFHGEGFAIWLRIEAAGSLFE